MLVGAVYYYGSSGHTAATHNEWDDRLILENVTQDG
jgi:hypothetical protein